MTPRQHAAAMCEERGHAHPIAERSDRRDGDGDPEGCTVCSRCGADTTADSILRVTDLVSSQYDSSVACPSWWFVGDRITRAAMSDSRTGDTIRALGRSEAMSAYRAAWVMIGARR